VTIKKLKDRDKSPYNIKKDKTQCLQQSDIANNDGLEFTKPMAEYLAYILS